MALKMKMEVYSTDKDDDEDSNVCKPHFFKIIVSPTIQLQQLRIPASFVEKSGKSLLDYASLRAADGVAWKVGLTKSKGDVWFDEGWQNFAQYYSLGIGHFLVFKYQGNSQFQVTILDKSCTEIEYPNRSTKNTETGESSDESRRRLDDENGVSKLRGVKTRAVERAKAFECSNPHFIIVMHKTFVSHPFLVTIPVSYTRQHMKEESKYTIRLQTGTKGKTWPANCYFTAEPRVKIGAGWKKFVRDNRLRVGDVCLFELIHPGTKAYSVHIFRK